MCVENIANCKCIQESLKLGSFNTKSYPNYKQKLKLSLT